MTEAEAGMLRQALTRQTPGGDPADAERCRQAEQLLAQQVYISLEVASVSTRPAHHNPTSLESIWHAQVSVVSLTVSIA